MNYCEELMNVKKNDEEIKEKRRKVYNYLYENVFNKNKNFENIKDDDIEKWFKIIDKVFFDNNLKKQLIKLNAKLDFIWCKKLKKSWGACNCSYKKFYDHIKWNFSIKISLKIFSNLFAKNEKILKNGGLNCEDRLSCYILTLEHEIIHLIIFMFCFNEKDSSHWIMFRKIIYNIFWHTKVTHNLLHFENDDELKKK